MGLTKIIGKLVGGGAAADSMEANQPTDQDPPAVEDDNLPVRPEYQLLQSQHHPHSREIPVGISRAQPARVQEADRMIGDGAAVSATVAAKTTMSPANPQFPKWVFCYYTSWSIYARGFRATSIPIEQMTHLLYGMYSALI